MCAGCIRPIREAVNRLVCCFHQSGFPLPGGPATPCGVAYHPQCIRAGEPFSTRRERGQGLTFPDVSTWSHFVCELCTVRAVLKRELGHKRDLWLLQLERMRMIDTAHHWAPGTNSQYQTRLLALRRFESQHPGLSLLQPSPLASPPSGEEIPLMWAELHASTQRMARMGRSKNLTPVFNTIRQYRSAASQFYTWDTLVCSQGQSYFSEGRLVSGPCRPIDCASYTLFTRGLSARMGTHTTPSTALLGRHVQLLDEWFEAKYMGNPTRAVAQAGLANVILWTSWMRASELFGLRWSDLFAIWPHEAAEHDLPLHTGALLLKLRAETKSSRTERADVAVALRTLSGLDLGRWLQRVATHTPTGGTESDTPLFQYEDGRPWDSAHYRIHYLYPGLEFLRSGGDPFLTSLSGEKAGTIPQRFYSLHCYRRGARTHCARSRAGTSHRKATLSQIEEHGRWRRRRSSEPVHLQYREWTLYERLRITLFSH